MNILKSQAKVITLQIMADALESLQSAAQGASDIDARLVAVATRGLKFAAQWTQGTRVTDQDLTRGIARDLIRAAENNTTHTKLTRAVLAFGQALNRFTACEYNSANIYAETAIHQIRE